jgi:hypothetical protein
LSTLPSTAGAERNVAPPSCAITVWGPPASGKTTLLSAFSIALARQQSEWRLVGADQMSAHALTQMQTSLAADRRFPPGSVGAGTLHWELARGLRPSPARQRRRLPRSVATNEPGEETRIGLDVTIVGDAEADGGRVLLADALTRSGGMILAYDPLREVSEGGMLNSTLPALADLARRGPVDAEGRLPHYVAVCITKFDDDRVLGSAERLGMLMTDPGDRFGFPRVADSDAREFLLRLAELSLSGTAHVLPGLLERTFRPERIRYFVTSAIGFHVGFRNVYDPGDSQNVISDDLPPGPARIRGNVRPINAAEPLLWLCEQLAHAQGTEL